MKKSQSKIRFFFYLSLAITFSGGLNILLLKGLEYLNRTPVVESERIRDNNSREPILLENTQLVKIKKALTKTKEQAPLPQFAPLELTIDPSLPSDEKSPLAIELPALKKLDIPLSQYSWKTQIPPPSHPQSTNEENNNAPLQELFSPHPDYPERAEKRGFEGVVKIKIFVSAQGFVEKIEVISNTGKDILVDAVLEKVKQWRFHPAKRQGKAIPSSTVKQFRFVLEEE